jgi:hypothetical protein
LPQELGCGSGMTCWRRLRDWQEEGVWDLMHFALLNWLAMATSIGHAPSWTVVPCALFVAGRKQVRIRPTVRSAGANGT